MNLYDYIVWGCFLFLLTLPWTIEYLPPRKRVKSGKR
jgi:hypothetical protein